MSNEIKFFWAAILAFVGLLGLVIYEAGSGRWTDFPATVVERGYRPSSVELGTGLVPLPDGSSQFVTTTNYAPEEWTVIVRTEGNVIASVTSPERWAEMKPGQSVTLQQRRSPIFGLVNGTWVR